jgi:Tol biopolymer transport system component
MATLEPWREWSLNIEGTLASIRLSRDGQRVAFVRILHPVKNGLFVRDLKTGRVDALVTPGTASWPDWSADDRQVVFTLNRQGRTGTALWAYDIDAGKSRELVTNAFLGRWSSDGRQLAYLVREDQRAAPASAVYLVSSQTGAVRRLFPSTK